MQFFIGLRKLQPYVLCKSDAAGEIVGAARQLGLLPEPALANVWPHNAVLERYVGTYKSTARSIVLYSAVPEKATPLVIAYASIVLSISQPAPILPY